MISDCHFHTSFSYDSDTAPEVQIERGIALGMEAMCVTDHYDMDFPGGGYEIDTEKYFPYMRELQEKYRDRIDLRIGVEMGLVPAYKDRIEAYLAAYPFDYKIGSIHMLQGKDPYYRDQYPQDDETLYRDFFELTAECVEKLDGFHSLGHLDYVVRYGYTQAEHYSYAKYADIIDTILRTIIRKNIALEVNAGGFKKGLGVPNPNPDIIKRYVELGGEMVTVGSDAHRVEHVGLMFDQIALILEDCGLQYVTEFKKGSPVWRKISK